MTKKAEKLAKIVDERFAGGRTVPGLRASNMLIWFQRLITERNFKTFSVEINKRTVQEDEDKKMTRIKKGVTLELAESLKENQSFLIEDPKTGVKHTLEIGWRGGEISGRGTMQNTYHHLILTKLTDDADLRKIQKNFEGRLKFPEEAISTRCSVYYAQKEVSPVYGEDYVESWSVSLTVALSLAVEGKRDTLSEQVCQFIKDRAGPKSRSN